MAIKIGKWYITRNNPRELLLELRYKQDIIDELEEFIKNKMLYAFKNEIGYYKEVLDKMKEIQNGSEDK